MKNIPVGNPQPVFSEPCTFTEFGEDTMGIKLGCSTVQNSLTHISTVASSSTFQIPNPDIPRVEAPGRAARQGRAKFGANRIIRTGNRSPPFFKGIEDTSLQRFPRTTNKRNPMLTDGGTKPIVYHGLPAVNLRVISRTKAGFVPGCRTV